MAIFIDPPIWPAHGTLWSHLISDSSYDELHQFASLLHLPRRGFDLDHYDLPEASYARAVSLGAEAVTSREVVRLLQHSGLRVRQSQREQVTPIRRREYLLAEWRNLADLTGASRSSSMLEHWRGLGDDLLTRWNEPHRAYHNERHLEDVLLALQHLSSRGEVISAESLLAAWFHDAVYLGTDTDEVDSADYAVDALSRVGLERTIVQNVRELVVATTPTFSPSDYPPALAHLLDADLSIFASAPSRYHQYALAVRAEYQHVDDDAFRNGRAGILESYLSRPTIYRTATAATMWERRARQNLANEIAALRSHAPYGNSP